MLEASEEPSSIQVRFNKATATVDEVLAKASECMQTTAKLESLMVKLLERVRSLTGQMQERLKHMVVVLEDKINIMVRKIAARKNAPSERSENVLQYD